ncbi:MAG: hypothetical protein P1P81_04375, partial [Desulfobulbales bacterium]|nr:hypothetical protein [Desulfobulbales bacterium]
MAANDVTMVVVNNTVTMVADTNSTHIIVGLGPATTNASVTQIITNADEVIEITATSLLGLVVGGITKKLSGLNLLAQIRTWLDVIYEAAGTALAKTTTHETTYSHDHTGLLNIGANSHAQIDLVLGGLGTASTNATGDFEPAGTTTTHETTYSHDHTGLLNIGA